MFSCTLCDPLRNKFFDEISEKYNFFNDLDVKSQILFLFNSFVVYIFAIMNFGHYHVISKT